MKRNPLLLLTLGSVAGLAASGILSASFAAPMPSTLIHFQPGQVAKAEDVNNNFALLEARISELEQALTPESMAALAEVLPHMEVVYLDNGQGIGLKTIRFHGVNLQVVNGLEATNGSPSNPDSSETGTVNTNGLGNLIVGYSEADQGNQNLRTGSHNLVVGIHHGYTSIGSLVAGQNNVVSAPYSSIPGGQDGRATGTWSCVAGGSGNMASGLHAVAAGGFHNLASGRRSIILGGGENEASGEASSTGGGQLNLASGYASVSWGGSENISSGSIATILGGGLNKAQGYLSLVSGGQINVASGDRAVVTGGSQNTAAGTWSTIHGGCGQTALGTCSHGP